MAGGLEAAGAGPGPSRSLEEITRPCFHITGEDQGAAS